MVISEISEFFEMSFYSDYLIMNENPLIHENILEMNTRKWGEGVCDIDNIKLIPIMIIF